MLSTPVLTSLKGAGRGIKIVLSCPSLISAFLYAFTNICIAIEF